MTNRNRIFLRTLVAPLTVVALTLAITACLDLTEHPITGITDSYYSTPEGFDAAVSGSYEELRNFYGQERGLTVTVFGTDEFTKGADGSHKAINDYTAALNGDESYFRDSWRGFYRGINTANTVISRAPKAQVSDAVRNEAVAEARFLRALYYFDLVRMFGPVPLQLTETVGPMTEANRDSVSKVYDTIVADLQFAEATLPDVQKDYGRATRPAAEHLLALVYLTRAAPGDMAKAADEAKKVINSGLFSLLPNYSDLWTFGNEKNAEVVWSVQFTADPLTTGPGNSSHLYFLMAYELFPGMQRDLANGRAFKRFRPTTYLLNLWDRTKDSRYDDSFTNVYYANKASSIPKNSDGTPKFQVGDTAIWMPGYEISAAERASHPYTILTPSQYTDAAFPSFNKKFIDPFRLTVNDVRGSRDWDVMRLAETYLIAAEALMRDGKPDEAVTYVNAVRERAAKPGVPKSAMDVTAADLNIDFILDERSRELGGEGMRWFDLVRTGKLLERVGKYNPAAAANIKSYHVLRPIPNEQITLTSNTFAQNPGY
ncbi:MAG TPA: RagB/SusD family nutrient uptake outer membrane protein [Gemmatimonadaceae bacterium]|nr:RagB/SusD family nutrient uptake outer membrane protein [Gemmatimonadaceae bacterium]